VNHQIILMGSQTRSTKGRVMLIALKEGGDELREPTRPIRLADAIKAIIKRGYKLAEQARPDVGLFQARLEASV